MPKCVSSQALFQKNLIASKKFKIVSDISANQVKSKSASTKQELC